MGSPLLQGFEVKKTATYVTKYVTKEMQNSIVGKGKKYWCSRGLRLPAVSYTDLNLGEDLILIIKMMFVQYTG